MEEPVTVKFKEKDQTGMLAGAWGLLAEEFTKKVNLEEKLKLLEDKLTKTIQEKNPTLVRIEFKVNDQEPVKVSQQHYKFPLVMKVISCSLNVALYGPAGTGKSYMGKKISEILDKDFYTISFNALSSKADILGFIDAKGKYHPSIFRKAFEKGGVFLADEFDACNAGVATIMNSAIANGFCTFADSTTIDVHKDFVFIAAMNTPGTGGNYQYTSRNRLDAATLDRFFTLSGYFVSTRI